MQDIFTILHQIIEVFLFGSKDPNIHSAWIGLAALAISAAVTGYGMYKKGQANKKAQAEIDKQNREYGKLSSWYDAESSKDFMDTDVAKSTLGKINAQYKKGIEINASNAARGGATAEAQVANKAALNEKYNNVLNNMVGYGTQYQSNLKKEYGNALTTMASGQNAYNFGNVQGWGNIAGNAGEAFANTAGSTDWESMFANKGNG